MKLNLHLPINSTSFGQTSILILRTLFDEIKSGKRSDGDFSIYPVSEIDNRTQELPQDFSSWLYNKINETVRNHKRSTPTFKLWHLSGSLESISEKQTLLSFYELDQPTDIELNIAKNNNTLFSSNYSIENFKSRGASASFLPLAFDSYNFQKTTRAYFSDERVVFNLCGKLEKRKNHEKIIKAWIKRFKNDRRFFLQCSIYNPFMKPEVNSGFVNNILSGEKPFNVHFLGFLEKNAAYNDYLNSSNIVIGMSGGEGWGLPEFTSVCLGKHSIIMNAHSYKDWASESNSTLVPPSIKVEAYDGLFFHKGSQFNQGNIFDFNEDQFIDACEKAIKKVSENKTNEEGFSLCQKFSKEKLLENIIKHATP